MRKPVDAGAGGVAHRGESCPYLGLETDPSSFCRDPSPQHRCYLWMERSRIDLAHQATFCLTDSHAICPWLSIGGPASDRSDRTILRLWQTTRPVLARSSRRARVLAAAFWAWLLTAVARLGRLAADLAAAFWRRLRVALGRAVRFAGLQGRRLLVGLGRFALRLVALSEALAVRAWTRVRRRGGASLPTATPMAPTTPADAAETAPAGDAPAEAPDAGELIEQGILALRQGGREAAYALFVRASQLAPGSEDGWLWRAALAPSMQEKRECLEQLLRVNPESGLARSALAALERPRRAARPLGGPPARMVEAASVAAGGADATDAATTGRLAAARDVAMWQCDACETINTGPLRVCRSCGHPSPVVEEELMSSGDELLAEGLAGLRAGNEELAHGYFVKACKVSPDNELAWHWRAKTAPTLDEVIRCLEQLVKINPANAKARADLKWALERREREQVRSGRPGPAPRTQHPAARRGRGARLLRRVAGELRWWLLQAAGLCAFALGLALAVPYVVRLAGPPDRPELGEYLALLPALRLPELEVRPPQLPAFDVGPALPLLLGLLLLHAAFRVASGGGLGTRIWLALLGAAVAGLMVAYGANPPAPLYAAGLAALAVAGAVAGAAPAESREGRELRSASWR